MPERHPEFDAALAALDQPLSFLSRSGFEKVDRIVDLEATLRAAIARASAIAPSAEVRELLADLGRRVPQPGASREQRMGGLRDLKAHLDAYLPRLRSLAPSAVDRAPAEPPASENVIAILEPRVEDDSPGNGTGGPVGPDGSGLALDSPVQYLRGVGPRIAALLETRGILTVGDLLRFLPRRYEDRRGAQTIAQLTEGSHVTVVGEVLATSDRGGRGRRRFEVAIGDATGVLKLRWFRVPGKGFGQRFAKGRRIRASGVVRRFQGACEIIHPETSVVDDADAQVQPTDVLVPIYPEIEGLRPGHVRRIVNAASPSVSRLQDVLPASLRQRRGLPAMPETILRLHRPTPDTPVEELAEFSTPWQRRLIYEELLLVQLAVLRRKHAAAADAGVSISFPKPLSRLAAEVFPFPLTTAQLRVLDELESDLGRPQPMNRLLQGDVGSGKTAVAIGAAAAVAIAGLQAAIMAPTELLAEQLARVALRYLTPIGIRVDMLTGGATAAERRQRLTGLADGTTHVVVGTHALIQADVRFRELGLAIVDEQHRFGVAQRARLIALGRATTGRAPHLLVMTATPIPRTLAMTAYGDLDVSTIDELPPGRIPVATHLYRDTQRDQVYARVRHEAQAGRQAFVVFPLVDESEAEGLEAIRDATNSATELAEGFLAGIRVGLLHGRMTSDEKDAIMRRFLENEIQVLVATTVIEVGIDVPNATVMVIEHAERFGLSQLHQLRGRVGRGRHRGTCLLVARYVSAEDAWRRLKIMEQSTDGFRIAEEDLAIRGPGDFLGTRQSGLPLLAMANLARDQRVLQEAREDAARILDVDPDLTAVEHRGLADELARAWAGRIELAQIG